jgi:multimeric flavodoxin WrbA
MKSALPRRTFLRHAGVAALATTLVHGTPSAPAPSPRRTLKLLGIAASARKGMNTARAVQIALDAAKSVDPRIEVELIDLGGLKIAGWSPAPPQDDFTPLLSKLQDPTVAGLIIGSPSYYRSMSAVGKAFLERCAPLREPAMLLAGKPVGIVSVGAFRNGGQELVIEQLQAVMLCFGMIPVGGLAPAFQGATLHTTQDDIANDTLGIDTARKLGLHLAQTAVKLAS